MIQKREPLFVVDETNSPLDPQPRYIVHSTGLWHRTAGVWIINEENQLLGQKRSELKDTSKGLWEPFFGGHLAPGVSYVDGAYEEVQQELGIEFKKEDLRFFRVYKSEIAKEFQGIFGMNWSGDISMINLEIEEVAQVRWMSIPEVKLLMMVERDKSWTQMAYDLGILDWLVTI